MADRKPVEATNLDRYGAPIIPWSDVRDALDRLHEADVPFFLGTVYPDGHPHIAGFGPAWLDGDFYICTGLATQKAKNIAANPACTIAAHLPGYDLNGDGHPDEVTAPAMWVGSLISAVLGNILPGAGTLYRAQTFEFLGRAKACVDVAAREQVGGKRDRRHVVIPRPG